MATDEEPARKKAKARPTNSWKLFITENVKGPEGGLYGLADLFANGFDSTASDGSGAGRPTTAAAASSSSNGAAQRQQQRCNADKFYTLRLEHRMGGPVAQFRGEERILLFRSDRPGAIAKIIYSSELPEGKSPASHPRAMSKKEAGSGSADSPGAEEVQAEDKPHSTAHAKVHVLDVKSQYRGRDLGGLLFSEAITSLRARYCNDDDDFSDEFSIEGGVTRCVPVKSTGCPKQVYDVVCMLDAEEDITKHGKLVSFYEHLGCHVTSERVQYVNNNDCETYRKVPMQIDLHPPKMNSPSRNERARLRRKRLSHLIPAKGSFLPVSLVGSSGKLFIRSQETMKLDWLITETPDGVRFWTTHGHLLVATPDGAVTVLSPGDQDGDKDSDLDIDTKVLDKWTHFVPCHVSDKDGVEGDDISSISDPKPLIQNKSLWALRTCHGTFLTADSQRQTLSCTRLPSFWQANGANLSLVCTSDTPPRRHHYRKCWKFQTYDYVSSMRRRFLTFSLGKATLIDALGWINAFPAHPFHVWSSDESSASLSPKSAPTLRTLSFLMAETAREEGFPDWMQLVALLHELGEAVKILDPSNTGEMAESIYDWTISSRSRVVGCRAPQRATFREFRHLNMDDEDSRYNTATGVYEANCGLGNVHLMWCGCEYMYHLLKHNHVGLPEEAFFIIRYFLLGDWHEHHEYSSLTNHYDEDMLPFISEFDALRRRVRLKCLDCVNLTDEECSILWNSHYGDIAVKYNCDHIFDW